MITLSILLLSDSDRVRRGAGGNCSPPEKHVFFSFPQTSVVMADTATLSPQAARAFKLLGVSPDVSSDGLKAAWRVAALRTHPDRGGDPAEFRRVHEAYEFLASGAWRDSVPPPHERRVHASGPVTWEDIATPRASRREDSSARDRSASLFADVVPGFFQLWRDQRRPAFRVALLAVLALTLAASAAVFASAGAFGAVRALSVVALAGALTLLLALESAGRVMAFGPGWERVLEVVLPAVALAVLFWEPFIVLTQVAGMVILVGLLVRGVFVR